MNDNVTGIENIEIESAEGRKTAQQHLAELGRTNAIHTYNRICVKMKEAEAEPEADAQVLDRYIEQLQNCLDDIAFFEKHIEKPSIHVLQWDNIEVQPREWLIPNWLPANTCTLFTGKGGEGKSWLTLQMVCQIACGFNNAFLNPEFQMPSDADDSIEPKHIIFATYEDENAEIKRRIQSLASEMKWIEDSMDTIKQHLHIVDMRGIGSIWGPGIGHHIANTGDLLPAGYELQHICEDKKARLLVIDPLSGAFGGNENDRTAVYDFISSFRRWGDTAKCAVLVVGHLPKSTEGKNAGFSGSTAWEASVRSMWLLSIKEFGDEAKPFYALSHTKSNYARLQADKPLIKSLHGWWKLAEDESQAVEGYQNYQNNIKEDNHNDNPYKDT